MPHTLRTPDDFHVHLRRPPLLAPVVEATARSFGRVLVMPNTAPPITSAERMADYRREILRAVPPTLDLEPLLTFKVGAGIPAADVRGLKAAGAIGGKLYPAGVTTNSADGVRDVESVYPLLEAMEEHGMVLEVHAEHPDAFCLDREEAYLPVVRGLVRRFPALRVVIEHVSSAAAVRAIADLPPTVGATVTAHHLLLTLDDVIGDGLSPHNFCKPVAKRPEDRQALEEAVLSGDPRFFFGSDSAPHLRGDKESATGCAGVYTAPVAIPLLAEFFSRQGLPLTESAAGRPTAVRPTANLESFVSRFGAEFYRLPLATSTIRLTEDPWVVPDEYHGVVPFRAGTRLSYRAERRHE